MGFPTPVLTGVRFEGYFSALILKQIKAPLAITD